MVDLAFLEHQLNRAVPCHVYVLIPEDLQLVRISVRATFDTTVPTHAIWVEPQPLGGIEELSLEIILEDQLPWTVFAEVGFLERDDRMLDRVGESLREGMMSKLDHYAQEADAR